MSSASFSTTSRRYQTWNQTDLEVIADADPDTCLTFIASQTPPCHTDITIRLPDDVGQNVTVGIVGDNLYCNQSLPAGKLYVVPIAGNATDEILGRTKTCEKVDNLVDERQAKAKPSCTFSCVSSQEIGALRIIHRPFSLPCESWSLCTVMAPVPGMYMFVVQY